MPCLIFLGEPAISVSSPSPPPVRFLGHPLLPRPDQPLSGLLSGGCGGGGVPFVIINDYIGGYYHVLKLTVLEDIIVGGILLYWKILFCFLNFCVLKKIVLQIYYGTYLHSFLKFVRFLKGAPLNQILSLPPPKK